MPIVIVAENVNDICILKTHLVEARSKQPGNLLDKSVRAEEGVVGLGQVLHLLLVMFSVLSPSSHFRTTSPNGLRHGQTPQRNVPYLHAASTQTDRQLYLIGY